MEAIRTTYWSKSTRMCNCNSVHLLRGELMKPMSCGSAKHCLIYEVHTRPIGLQGNPSSFPSGGSDLESERVVNFCTGIVYCLQIKYATEWPVEGQKLQPASFSALRVYR